MAVENAVRVAGAKDYESGMIQARKLVDFVQNRMQQIQTIEDFRSALDSCQPMSKREEKLAFFALKFLPQFFRLGLKMASKHAEATLPPLPAGRPRAANASKTQEILDFIAELHRKGCDLRAAKTRATRKYSLSLRTIERLWSNRGSIQEDDPTIEDVFKYLKTGEAK